MTTSDAFVVEGEWVGEHYFTSTGSDSFANQVKTRRKAWDDEPAGSSRQRFMAHRGEIEKALSEIADAEPEKIQEYYRLVLDVLGYCTGQFELRTDGPTIAVHAPGVDEPALVIVQGQPVTALEDAVAKKADTLLRPAIVDDDEIASAASLISHLAISEDGPKFMLLLAGAWAIIADRERWPEGRYLAVNLQLVAERNDTKRGGEIDTALTCLEARSLAPDADGEVWWSTALAESTRHAVGVSKDLREGVRLSIEIIANDVVRRRRDQGLEPLPADQAQPLAKQALRYLYRILFLLYAEASPELGVLPVGTEEYDGGYGLDRLRELTLVTLTDRSTRGTHLYDSLGLLFRLVDRGNHPNTDDDVTEAPGLVFNELRADLFAPSATALIDEVGIGNGALQEVLRHLLLSKESKGRERGFISYAELGINQLGAVYEGLMSYTGFFATETLYEVAPGGDSSKGSWVVPVHRADHLDEDDFVTTTAADGTERKVRHEAGTFVFRLAGRERQQSASYYTPEVLTRFVVSQALAELLTDDMSAEDILGLSVCEPALGSGAFAIEATRQLAAEYLRRRQDELGERIDPDAYAAELQKVKAHIALHQVHGVDLNATAVELAEVSLWLDTMVAGLQAPWFGLRLRRGNSLIGARRATYTQKQLAEKAWLTSTPSDVPMTELGANLAVGKTSGETSGRVHHFLLPAYGWGSAAEAPKLVRDLARDEVAALKKWRAQVRKKPGKKEIEALVALGERVEVLWQFALRRLQVAERESSRAIDVWGRETPAESHAVSREQIEASLADETGAYRRLRLVMDLWCAMWFWPLTETGVTPPDLAQWIDALQGVLGRAAQPGRRSTDAKQTARGQISLADATTWVELEAAEQTELLFSAAKPIPAVRAEHPWIAVAERIAERQGFFHWQLDFAAVFADGGFDLQVGNPPWVRPDVDENGLLAEGDPWWQLANKPSEADKNARRPQTLALSGIRDLMVNGATDVVVLREFVSDSTLYALLDGLRPDLYRVFMSTVWAHGSARGIQTLIHPETHFTDEKAANLRRATYRRLRRHWQFVNELVLFEIDHHVSYGVHVYGSDRDPHFVQATALYHPDTVEQSFRHDGSGVEPGFKHEGSWDRRAHRGRLQVVDGTTLQSWRDALETMDSDPTGTRMVYTVNTAATETLKALSRSPRVGDDGLAISTGWDEGAGRRAGRFVQEWGPAQWRDAILQGPHLHVSTPLYKAINPTMKHNQDWSDTDFEALAPDALPVTQYKPTGDRATYDALYTRWGPDRDHPARDFYRIAWRAMAANTGERTLTPALIPPGTAHVNGVFATGSPFVNTRRLTLTAGAVSSLLADFAVRIAPKSGIYEQTFGRLPNAPVDHPLAPELLLRTLRLNCVTNAYADLWAECFDPAYTDDAWTAADDREGRIALGEVGLAWTPDTPLRRVSDRRRALVEIDALVALMLGVDIDSLCTIYRTQFAVLYGYDHHEYTYDRIGRLVPNSVLSVWRKRGDAISDEERTATNAAGVTYTYELPFATCDREADMRAAYAEFSQRLADRGGDGLEASHE